MKNITRDINTGEYKRVYLLYGEEEYLKKMYAKKLAAAVCDPEDTMNTTVFQGDSLDINELIGISSTMPFFADRRLVIVYGSGLFKGKGSTAKDKDEEPEDAESTAGSGSDKDKLTDFIKEIPDTTVLVFVEKKDREKDGRKITEVDKRSRLFKAVVANGYAAEINAPSENDLRNWIAQGLAKNGKRISAATADYLVKYAGQDMQNLKNEIDKLVLYAFDREVITNEDIDAVCVKALSARIFDMTDSMVTGRRREALSIYATLTAMREPVQMIFYMLLRHYDQLYVIKEMKETGAGRGEMASAISAQDFVVRKLLQQSERYTLSQIREMIEYGVGLECDWKSGKISPDNIVELFIMHNA